MPPRQRLRRDAAQAQTREALIDAAQRLFDARGFAATSIADIAEEAGYTTGALYSNFANKEDLYIEVLERHVSSEIRQLASALSTEQTPSGRIKVVGTWWATKAGKGRRRIRAIAELALLSQGQTHPRLLEQRKMVIEAVAGLLRQQEAELGIRFQMPADELATVIMALLHGFALGGALGDNVDATVIVAALELLLQSSTAD